LALLLLCTFVFSGCDFFAKRELPADSKVDKVVKTPDEKKAELLKEIDRKFENPDAHFQLGQLYLAEGQWLQAEYHYDRALDFDPVHWPAQAGLVKMYLGSGDAPQAKQYAHTCMNKVAGSADRSLQLAQAFQSQQLDEYALACYQQALRLAPESAQVNKGVGYYYLGKGDKQRAKAYFIRSFKLNRYQPDVAKELGRLGVVMEIPRETKKDTKKPDKSKG
jgi:tetratricopeptide (TPR) repeat protein